MKESELFAYKIEDAGMHCTVDIYVANIYIGTLDTGTKYVESAEEEIAEIFKNVFKKLLGDKLTFKEVNE